MLARRRGIHALGQIGRKSNFQFAGGVLLPLKNAGLVQPEKLLESFIPAQFCASFTLYIVTGAALFLSKAIPVSTPARAMSLASLQSA